MSRPKQIPMWYVGGFREPERVTIAEGAEWPDVDSAGNEIVSNPYHFAKWSDARDAILAEHNAGRKLDTRDVIDCEHRLDLARKRLAETCKELLAVEKLIEPEEETQKRRLSTFGEDQAFRNATIPRTHDETSAAADCRHAWISDDE